MTGARRLVASLRAAGGGEVLRGSGQPLVTVFDPATAGYWVHDRGTVLAHDGAVQGAATRVELVDGLPPAARLALQRTEPNLCDDDGDGVDDNEGRLFYATGDTDITGDFRMAVPASPQAWYLYEGEPPSPDASVGQGFGGLASGHGRRARDDRPGRATGRAARPRRRRATPAGISLTWGAADAAGPCGYLVYRWTDGEPSDPFTPLKTVVTHTPADQLTFVDSDVAAGTRYHYEVRAEDAQTNVGPRSNEATATTLVPPDLEPTTMVLGRVPSRIAYRRPGRPPGVAQRRVRRPAVRTGGARRPLAGHRPGGLDGPRSRRRRRRAGQLRVRRQAQGQDVLSLQPGGHRRLRGDAADGVAPPRLRVARGAARVPRGYRAVAPSRSAVSSSLASPPAHATSASSATSGRAPGGC